MCVRARYMCPCMCHYMYPWYVSLYAGERDLIARARALDLICVLICGLIYVSLHVSLHAGERVPIAGARAVDKRGSRAPGDHLALLAQVLCACACVCV